MFIGHWAPAFAAAALTKRSPKLGTLFIAGQLVDWGFFIFATVGLEKMRITPGATAMNPLDLYHMPFTHSLLGSALWAAVFALVLVVLRREPATALVGGAVVLSHWVVDLLVHRPDLSIAGGEGRYGFGLWNYPAIAISLELVLTIGAFLWYIKRTHGPLMPPWILLVVLLAMQAINWFGPQPTEAGPALYFTALASFAIATALAYWVGTSRRHIQERGLAAASRRR